MYDPIVGCHESRATKSHFWYFIPDVGIKRILNNN